MLLKALNCADYLSRVLATLKAAKEVTSKRHSLQVYWHIMYRGLRASMAWQESDAAGNRLFYGAIHPDEQLERVFGSDMSGMVSPSTIFAYSTGYPMICHKALAAGRTYEKFLSQRMELSRRNLLGADPSDILWHMNAHQLWCRS